MKIKVTEYINTVILGTCLFLCLFFLISYLWFPAFFKRFYLLLGFFVVAIAGLSIVIYSIFSSFKVRQIINDLFQNRNNKEKTRR